MNVGERGPTRAQRVLIEACLEHGVPFWWRGRGTLLISGSGVLAVLGTVEAAGERIIGLEGFELGSDVILPRLDLIYDSGIAVGGGAAAVATEWGEGIWLDVTLSANPTSPT